MDVAKILTKEDFLKVLAAYKPLVDNPQAIVSDKNDLKQKMENFIRKTLLKMNKEAAKKESGPLSNILNFLILLDKELPY